jgi:hypothetical protein
MSDNADPFAELAVGLNEDAKASRAKRKPRDEASEIDTSGYAEAVESEADEVAALIDGPLPANPMDDFVEEAPEVEAIEIAAEEFQPDPSEAVQALRDYTLQIIKDLDKPWHKLPQERQVDLARAIEHSSKDVVRTIVEMIAARGQKPVRVLLKKIAAGDKIQITGEVSLLGAESPDESLLLLHHAIGKHVMLTRATVEDYAQGGDAETDDDEPIMDFGSD